MWQVAQAHNTTLEAIQELNPNVNLHNVEVGQNIRLPGEGINFNFNINIDIDFNKLKTALGGFFRYMERGDLAQNSNKEKYELDCFKFATAYSMLMSGKKPNKLFWRKIIADLVHDRTWVVADILEGVFGIENAQVHDIPTGLSENELKQLIGNNPAVLHYSQSDFWGPHRPNDESHAVGYYKGKIGETYFGKSGKFDKLKGNNNTSIEDYSGGYYITW
jgi:LysM repeat protein